MSADVCWMDIRQLTAAMSAGDLTAGEIVRVLLDRISEVDRSGPTIRSVIELNPDAIPEAESSVTGETQRPIAGIPVLLKDNIDTVDSMHTTAGSLALESSVPSRDAFVVKRLREAGAILLGKANMSEWANFRSTRSSSGWSARGGQALKPYVLNRSPCGSSSGSASAVAAGLVPAALGTETDGSILCPAAMCGVVGIKPTVGLTSRSGVVPISHTQDTVGTFGRTVTDAVMLLGAITGIDNRDPITRQSAGKAHQDYTPFLDRAGLMGARIGVPREVYFGYSPQADVLVDEALRAMRLAGAEIIDPVEITTARDMKEGETTVLLHEFKADLNTYLQTRRGDGPRSLEEVIAFNDAHSEVELRYFGQELFLQAQETRGLSDPQYLKALETDTKLAREEGIDAALNRENLDVLAMPTTGPAFTIDLVNGDHHIGASSQPAALAGYPAISVPIGYVHGLPIGITLMSRAFTEPVLIRIAYALEQQLQVWRPPTFISSVEA